MARWEHEQFENSRQKFVIRFLAYFNQKELISGEKSHEYLCRSIRIEIVLLPNVFLIFYGNPMLHKKTLSSLIVNQ